MNPIQRELTKVELEKVELKKVSKLFGDVRALSNVDVTFSSKEIVSIMGGNGAGKSTLLSIISLLMRPTRGEVLFDGKSISGGDGASRGTIGYLSHKALLYPDLTGQQNLEFYMRLCGCKEKDRIPALREQLQLGPFFENRPCRVLSRGQLQRVSLARALLLSPRLLLLDEPASGLDAGAISRIEKVVATHASVGGITVMVTHEPELAAALSTRVVMMQRGKVVVDTPAPDSSKGVSQLYLQSMEEGAR